MDKICPWQLMKSQASPWWLERGFHYFPWVISILRSIFYVVFPRCFVTAWGIEFFWSLTSSYFQSAFAGSTVSLSSEVESHTLGFSSLLSLVFSTAGRWVAVPALSIHEERLHASSSSARRSVWGVELRCVFALRWVVLIDFFFWLL